MDCTTKQNGRRARRQTTPSPLDTLDGVFATLVAPPGALAVDGRALGHGLPARSIPLDELKRLLLRPGVPYGAKDAALGEVVRRAQAREPAWVVGLGGVLLTGLRRVAGRLARGFGADTTELDGEVVVGLLSALEDFDPTGGRIAARLLWAAHRHAEHHRRRELTATGRSELVASSVSPHQPWGHPDLVLAEAVADGVITAAHARLIGDTRLEQVPLAAIARREGVSVDALCHRRWRAEGRLVRWLSAGKENPEIPASYSGPKSGLV